MRELLPDITGLIVLSEVTTPYRVCWWTRLPANVGFWRDAVLPEKGLATSNKDMELLTIEAVGSYLGDYITAYNDFTPLTHWCPQEKNRLNRVMDELFIASQSLSTKTLNQRLERLEMEKNESKFQTNWQKTLLNHQNIKKVGMK